MVKALEGLEGAENCAGYSFVEQRGTWAAETKRLEKELAAHSKHKQRVGVLHVSSRRMSFIFRQMHAGLHGRSTGLVSVFPLEDHVHGHDQHATAISWAHDCPTVSIPSSSCLRCIVIWDREAQVSRLPLKNFPDRGNAWPKHARCD